MPRKKTTNYGARYREALQNREPTNPAVTRYGARYREALRKRAIIYPYPTPESYLKAQAIIKHKKLKAQIRDSKDYLEQARARKVETKRNYKLLKDVRDTTKKEAEALNEAEDNQDLHGPYGYVPPPRPNHYPQMKKVTQIYKNHHREARARKKAAKERLAYHKKLLHDHYQNYTNTFGENLKAQLKLPD